MDINDANKFELALEKDRFRLENEIKEFNIKKKQIANMTDIEDVLDYSVDSHMWLLAVKGKIPFTDLIDNGIFLAYLEDENEKFCEVERLCTECRSHMERQEQKEEICGSIRTSEVLWACSRGC